MPTIYKRKCNHCGIYYEKAAKFFCSKKCAGFGISDKTRKKLSEAKKLEWKTGKRKSHPAWNKGKPAYWIKGKLNPNWNKFGRKHPKWKKGKSRGFKMRWVIFNPNHSRNGIGTRIYQSRLTMEKIIGRKLYPNEVVHHIDFNQTNDAPNNLMLFASQKEHLHFHKSLNKTVKKLSKNNRHFY